MATEEKTIQIMELFGPTIQGEGIMTGTVTHFLRTGGCGLRCSWCDSLFAVLPEQIKKHRMLLTTAEILTRVSSLGWAPYITFTGGDPAIQERLGDIIPALNASGMRVAVETQGMHFPEWFHNCDVLTFSPKGPSSGNVVEIPPLRDFCVGIGHRRSLKVCIKVVIFNEMDFEYALDVYNQIPEWAYDAFYFTAGTPPYEPHVARSFGGATRILDVVHNEQQVAACMLAAVQEGVKFSDRVHLGC
ncbi:MAG: radical SAM protein, partial [Dehalococcoidales bacterium]